MDLLDHRDPQDHQVPVETQAEMDHLDSPVDLLKASRSFLETLDSLENLDHLDCPEILDHPAETDSLAALETEDHLDHPATLEAQEDQATQDPKDHLDCQENAVSVPNTALSTEASSSKMEHEERNKDLFRFLRRSFMPTTILAFCFRFDCLLYWVGCVASCKAKTVLQLCAFVGYNWHQIVRLGSHIVLHVSKVIPAIAFHTFFIP